MRPTPPRRRAPATCSSIGWSFSIPCSSAVAMARLLGPLGTEEPEVDDRDDDHDRCDDERHGGGEAELAASAEARVVHVEEDGIRLAAKLARWAAAGHEHRLADKLERCDHLERDDQEQDRPQAGKGDRLELDRKSGV